MSNPEANVQLPEAHDDCLFVTVGPGGEAEEVVRAAGLWAARELGLADDLLAGLGLGAGRDDGPVARRRRKTDLASITARLTEQGLIVGSVPLLGAGNPTIAQGLAGPAAISIAMAESLTRTVATPPRRRHSTRTNVLRVRDAAARDKVLTALAAFPGIEVSLVPRRYLQVRRPRPTRTAVGRTGASPSVSAATPPAAGTSFAHWHLAKTETDAARRSARFVEPRHVAVAVLDTGIDEGHPQLAGRIGHYEHSYAGLPVVSSPQDIVGHGTHVAGSIMAAAHASSGVVGMCACDLSVLKIFDDQTEYFADHDQYMYAVHPIMYVRALAACVDLNVRVANLSIGGTAPPSRVEADALNELTANGCTIVAAMGNDRSLGSPFMYPAAHPGVIAVGATDPGDRLTEFSNRGPHIWVTAPGRAIWSTMPTYSGQTGFRVDRTTAVRREGRPIQRERDYDALDGTSMATPQVAAAIAMYLAADPAATPTDVRTALQGSADKVAGMAGRPFHEDYGYGRLNVAALLR
jgi:hypothetical protein